MVQVRKTNGQFGPKIPIANVTLLPPSPMGAWGEGTQKYFVQRLTENLMSTRTELIKHLTDPRRDIDDECGFPSIIETEHYREMYRRESVARRVVNLMPTESWAVQPTILETEDSDIQTEFEKAWEELPNSLITKSWFRADKDSNPIWEYLQRADVLSGIGSYGVILLGISDGLELSEEAAPKKGQTLTFIRTFDQSLVSIAKTDMDIASPRFGWPIEYNIELSNAKQEAEFGETPIHASPTAEIANVGVKVHWTRVIHVADNLGSSEIFGTPRMQGPFNRLLGLRQTYGGSSEMYWKGALPGLALQTPPQMGFEGEISEQAASDMKDQMEKYMSGLQRYFTLTGLQANSLAPQVVDPTPQIDAYIKAICIQIGVPKRIFEGSERGELSSSQDAKAWNKRLTNRQNMYLTPRVVAPFVDRLIWLMILPEPKKTYSIIWPDLESLTEAERAEIAVKRTDSMVKYLTGDGTAIMEPIDFYTRIQGMKQEESEAILQAVADKIIGEGLPEPPTPEVATQPSIPTKETPK